MKIRMVRYSIDSESVFQSLWIFFNGQFTCVYYAYTNTPFRQSDNWDSENRRGKWIRLIAIRPNRPFPLCGLYDLRIIAMQHAINDSSNYDSDDWLLTQGILRIREIRKWWHLLNTSNATIVWLLFDLYGSATVEMLLIKNELVSASVHVRQIQRIDQKKNNKCCFGWTKTKDRVSTAKASLQWSPQFLLPFYCL